MTDVIIYSVLSMASLYTIYRVDPHIQKVNTLQSGLLSVYPV